MSASPILDPTGITLTKFISSEASKVWYATGQFSELINCLQIIAKNISGMVNRSGLNYFLGVTDRQNETTQILSLANDIFHNILFGSNRVGVILSKTSKQVIDKPKEKKGKYIVCYDPLNGVTNLNFGIPVGSIFCVSMKENQEIPNVDDVTSKRTKIVAAGYVLYGGCTTFVFSTIQEVNCFVLDPQLGEFFLTNSNVQVPKRGHVYSINEGETKFWEEGLSEFVSDKKSPQEEDEEPYTGLYIGSLVADIHRIIIQGGIFMFPLLREKDGLELLYECRPLAFILDRAGGATSDGENSLLDVKLNKISQKTSMFAGSTEDVEDLIKFLNKYRAKSLLN